jgi:dual-specificity kinase
LDIWSCACLIAEMYLGKPLFETHDNMEHLALMQEILGPVPSRVIEYADHVIASKYFYADNTLRWPEDATSVSSMQYVAETESLKEQIQDESLASLLAAMLHYDPEKRISAKVALAHQFFNK